MSASLHCPYFETWRCRSCTLLADEHAGSSAAIPLAELPAALRSTTARQKPWVRCAHPFGSRAKAKVSVSGSTQQPILGLLDKEFKGIELLSCPLHKMLINDALSALPALITRYGLTPYAIKERTGELKNLILQCDDLETQLRIRFVLRSESEVDNVALLAEELEEMLNAEILISANIQAIPHQILEGPKEIHLLGEELLWEDYNDIAVAFPATAFMQVTPEIAGKLYQHVAALIAERADETVLDLYCGAGGFALAAAPVCKSVLGVEVNEAAIVAARLAAEMNECTNTRFLASDLDTSTALLKQNSADTIICNPPRRGLQKNLCKALTESDAKRIIYSSCNPDTLLRDAEALFPTYELLQYQPFEMFPLTKHFETLAVFHRRGS